MKFNNREKLQMLLVYGACDENAVRAKIVYGNKYPERNQPSRRTFQRLCNSLIENGSFSVTKRKRNKTITNENNTIAVLGTIAYDPHISTRQIEQDSGISRNSIHRILQRNKFHPYHVSLHQELHGTDFDNRVRFCQWFLHQIGNNNSFLQNVLFTDEATFNNRGHVNLKNMHYWAQDNPHWLREVEYQRQWSVNVWCGILGNKIIGPYFIDGALTGQKYSTFLTETLPVLLENIPLNVRQVMWYQHDGCPAHYAQQARNIVQEHFPNRWIGRGGIFPWPPRSPDMTPLDYFLWGALKDIVYRVPPTTEENMQQRIREACTALAPETIQDATLSFINRLNYCIHVNGHHFEHLL